MRQNLPPIYFTITSITTWTIRGRENATLPLLPPQLTINNISVVAFTAVSPAIIAFLITDVIILSE